MKIFLLNMIGLFKFWEFVPWLVINWKIASYPVINERSVRAWAWIMFLIWLYAFINASMLWNYFPLKIVVVLFFYEFATLSFLWTKFSIINRIASYFVSNQKPDYVWVIQKRFAWSLWLIMVSVMLIVVLILNLQWIYTYLICLICLSFMWLEASFWICVWCKIYYWLIKYSLIKEPVIRPACPWWVCSIN